MTWQSAELVQTKFRSTTPGSIRTFDNLGGKLCMQNDKCNGASGQETSVNYVDELSTTHHPKVPTTIVS